MSINETYSTSGRGEVSISTRKYSIGHAGAQPFLLLHVCACVCCVCSQLLWLKNACRGEGRESVEERASESKIACLYTHVCLHICTCTYTWTSQTCLYIPRLLRNWWCLHAACCTWCYMSVGTSQQNVCISVFSKKAIRETKYIGDNLNPAGVLSIWTWRHVLSFFQVLPTNPSTMKL